MGSINRIWNPLYWRVKSKGENKILKEDIIYQMIIGESEDYGYCEIIEFISKDNYEKIIKGIYDIEIFPYASIPILLFNENRNLIPLIKGSYISTNKLNIFQKECIDKKILIKK